MGDNRPLNPYIKGRIFSYIGVYFIPQLDEMWLKWLRFIPISYLPSSTRLDRGKERELLTGLKSIPPNLIFSFYFY